MPDRKAYMRLCIEIFKQWRRDGKPADWETTGFSSESLKDFYAGIIGYNKKDYESTYIMNQKIEDLITFTLRREER